jgi:hypothetical protein
MIKDIMDSIILKKNSWDVKFLIFVIAFVFTEINFCTSFSSGKFEIIGKFLPENRTAEDKLREYQSKNKKMKIDDKNSGDSSGIANKSDSRKKYTKTKKLILTFHHLHPPHKKYPKKYEPLFFTYKKAVKSIKILVKNGFAIRKGEVEIGLDDNHYIDQKLFFKMAKYFNNLYPKKCDRDAWSINIASWKMPSKTRKILREFVKWGGSINNHTRYHLNGKTLSRKGFLDDYSMGLKQIYRVLKDQIEFEKIGNNQYLIFLKGKEKRYIQAVVPFGSITGNQIRYLYKKGIPFYGKRIYFREIQLFDNKVENGILEDGVSRIFFHYGTVYRINSPHKKFGGYSKTSYGLRIDQIGISRNLTKIKKLIKSSGPDDDLEIQRIALRDMHYNNPIYRWE